MNEALALILACALDAMIGDPHWLPHPVVGIGKAMEKLEGFLRKHMTNLTLAGFILAAVISGGTYALTYTIEQALFGLMDTKASLFAFAAFVVLTSTTLASRGLITSVLGVLRANDIETARKRLSHIVGRNTSTLDMDGVRRAAMETLAENASDGIVAPLFYFAIGGLPLAMFYKAVNTLDSMVGYRNEKYMQLGRASARLDDIMNLIPARLTGLLIALASFMLGQEGLVRSLGTMLRDGRKHLSPNSGIPEAAMAGALGIRLGGPAVYEDRVVDKPYIGEAAEGVDYLSAGVPAIKIAVAASVAASALAALGVFIRSGGF